MAFQRRTGGFVHQQRWAAFTNVWDPIHSWQAARPIEMRPGVTEEAQRVIEAMNAVEAIADPEVRARAIGEVLADQAARAQRWREDRRAVVLEMRGQVPPVSYRKIAAALGVSLRT